LKLPKFYYIISESSFEAVKKLANIIEYQANEFLIQLRMKGVDLNEFSDSYLYLKDKLDDAQLIIVNDHLEIALSLNADGIHLGQLDYEALSKTQRQQLAEANMIKGITINSMANAKQTDLSLFEYAGIGPYKYTQTKKNLVDTLSPVQLEELIAYCNKQLDVYVIGGINLTDVRQIKEKFNVGVAVSGDISQSADVSFRIKEYLDLLNQITK